MNPINRKNWNSNLYLDTLGSLAVIAAGAVVAVLVAATALPDAIAAESRVADSCVITRHASANPVLSSPELPGPGTGTACA